MTVSNQWSTVSGQVTAKGW